MSEQTSVRSQSNAAASHSACYWTEKGSNRQKQPPSGQAATLREPQLPPAPAVRWRIVMEKKCTVRPLWFGCRFHVLSVGLFYFYAQRPEFPMRPMSCLHSATARRSESQTAHHWMLLLSSVPFASDIFIFPMEWPTWFTPSLRGGMRSLMRSRPLASSKLVILCCGENPRMAKRRKHTKGLGKRVPGAVS